MKKLLAITITAAAAALVATWRRVRSESDRFDPTEIPPPAAPKEDPPVPPAPGSSSPVVSDDATKAELYEVAQRLDIEGRSKMSKAELLRAIRAAG